MAQYILRLMVGALALSDCDAYHLRLWPTSLPHRALHLCRRTPSVVLSERGPVQQLTDAADDILTYLTNLGGYTGFTEADLKGGPGSNGGSTLDPSTDLERWGKQKEVKSEANTTAFVLLLILFPSALGFLMIQLYGSPAIFTFAVK